MWGESTKAPEGRVVGPKPGWEFSLPLQRPCLAAHVCSGLRHAALQLLLLFYHLVLAPSTFRVAMATFKPSAEDLVLLPHPALSCNKAWKVPSGPAVGNGWRAATISEGNRITQMREWGMNYMSYYSPRWQEQLFTDQEHQKWPPSNLTCVELLQKFSSKHTSRSSYTLFTPLALTK